MFFAECFFLPKPMVKGQPKTSMSTGGEITSIKNPRVKEARAMLNRRHREKTGRLLLEGRRLISDGLDQRLKPIEFFYTSQALERGEDTASLRSAMRSRGAKDYMVPDAVIRSFSDTVNPQGLVGIFEKPHLTLPERPIMSLICEEVRDPGNLGSLLRCAAASAVQFVALTPGCADVWSLKALRAGMGAQFRIPVRQGMSWADIIAYMRKNDIRVCIADGSAGKSYSFINWSIPSALIVGSEATGPSEAAFGAAHEKIAIPMAMEVESLNVAMAGAVILFEAKRQRDCDTRKQR
ncbi:RNA methyltransferase [Gracilaria domingensis]|nr:RNA methyltransferase [Gracilaria domingensis]